MNATTEPLVFGSRRYWQVRTKSLADNFESAVLAHGYRFHPDLRFLDEAPGAFFYYPASIAISVSLPDLTSAVGRLQWIGFLRLTATTSIEAAAQEMDAFLELCVVHELCHHLRHLHGRMEPSDHWTEEHAVNILTIAYLRTRQGWIEDQPRLSASFARMRRSLAGLRTWDLVEATHDDLEEVLHYDLGLIAEVDYQRAFALAVSRGVPVMQVIRDERLASGAQIAEAAARQALAKERFNAEYMKDLVVYWKLMIAQAQVEIVDPDLPPLSVALPLLLGTPPA